MSPPPQEPDYVAGFVATQRRSATAKQYGGRVRRFLRDRAPAAVSAVQTAELVDYVVAIGGEASRRKMTCALEAFFAHLTHEGTIVKDPARFLSRLVRDAIEKRDLGEALRKSGMTKRAMQSLRWRDVLTATMGARPAVSLALQDPLRRALSHRLLERLHGATVDDIDQILDECVAQ